MVFDIVG